MLIFCFIKNYSHDIFSMVTIDNIIVIINKSYHVYISLLHSHYAIFIANITYNYVIIIIILCVSIKVNHIFPCNVRTQVFYLASIKLCIFELLYNERACV